MNTSNEFKGTGTLVRESETKNVGQNNVHNFTLAFNNKNTATFVDCEAWGDVGNPVQRAHKGDFVTIEGYLKQDSWVSKTGEKRSKLKVVARKVESLGNAFPKDIFSLDN